MQFIDRTEELHRLRQLMSTKSSLAVLYGRRRVGKSRLLIEWTKEFKGLYWVADQSSSVIQRRYFAEEISHIFKGFSDVEYPSWQVLLKGLSREANSTQWQGPLVIDELPYLVKSSPDLPSILQHWIDAEKREGCLKVALAGSCQQMMYDSILSSDSPLYGRADELMLLRPLAPGYLMDAFKKMGARELFYSYNLWGGIPRYWELASRYGVAWKDALNELVLSPLGPLHDEANRLLREELPSAIHLRPILDIIGIGANKSSEIAGRLGTPVTSLGKSFQSLKTLGLITKEVPFGSDEVSSKKSLYKLADPFLRMWFRVVAPQRGSLNVLPMNLRPQLYAPYHSNLLSQSFEEICLMSIPHLPSLKHTFIKARRYWGAGEAEWDVVAESLDKKHILLGECKCYEKPLSRQKVISELDSLKKKGLPKVNFAKGVTFHYALFVMETTVVASEWPEGSVVIAIPEIMQSLR